MQKQVIVANQFYLIKKIGRGSFGHIYQAIHQSTKQLLALKIEKVSQNQQKMLLKESQIMLRLANQTGC